MNIGGPIRAAADTIEAGRRLIRADGDNGLSLAERMMIQLHRFAWRTPIHAVRLRGRHPLKLLGVPADPFAADPARVEALIHGALVLGSETIDVETIDFAKLSGSPTFRDHLQSFAWLRDLNAAADRALAAPVAELAMRRWLSAHGEAVTDDGWRPDLWGRRILFWTAYAPLILSSADADYRGDVLNALARGARHLDRCADRAQGGLPRIAGWAGVIAAGLLIPGGDARLARGETGMARALARTVHLDGGIASRSPVDQLELIELLTMLGRTYAARDLDVPEPIDDALKRAVPALLGVTLGDGGLSSWQSGGPVAAERVSAAVDASGVRARPLRQARDWGYQRLVGGATVLVVDAAPPPAGRVALGGCASTLAFELSDGPHRLVVNCGGGRGVGALPASLAQGLRTTAAHSTLSIAESNSTAIHTDGALGRGVIEVELDRRELEHGSKLEASHDGYVRRFGFVHRRRISLSGDGREIEGDDVLLPEGKRRARPKPASFTLRFHLAPEVEVSGTADGQGALLRIGDAAVWQFRCRGATLAVEEGIWIDEAGRPRGTRQLVASGEAPAGGASVSWTFKRAG